MSLPGHDQRPARSLVVPGRDDGVSSRPAVCTGLFRAQRRLLLLSLPLPLPDGRHHRPHDGDEHPRVHLVADRQLAVGHQARVLLPPDVRRPAAGPALRLPARDPVAVELFGGDRRIGEDVVDARQNDLPAGRSAAGRRGRGRPGPSRRRPPSRRRGSRRCRSRSTSGRRRPRRDCRSGSGAFCWVIGSCPFAHGRHRAPGKGSIVCQLGT
jgi:hypothetical protein